MQTCASSKVFTATRLLSVASIVALAVAGSAATAQAQMCQRNSGGTGNSALGPGYSVANLGRMSSAMGGLNNFQPTMGPATGLTMSGPETLQGGQPIIPVSPVFQRKLMAQQQLMAERRAAVRDRNAAKAANASSKKAKSSKPKKPQTSPVA